MVLDKTMFRCNLATKLFFNNYRGAKVDAMNLGKYTPLHHAAGSGKSEEVKLLLEAGAKTDMRTRHNDTPINLAAENGHLL